MIGTRGEREIAIICRLEASSVKNSGKHSLHAWPASRPRGYKILQEIDRVMRILFANAMSR